MSRQSGLLARRKPLSDGGGDTLVRGRKGKGGPVQASATAVASKTADGSEGKEEDVTLRTASKETAKGLLHRYVTAVQANMRQGSANSKTRSEVSGGGKKPYKQKGTGNARRGSQRTPLRVGGGVIFGPKPRDWSERMNRKEKRLAISTAIQNAADSGCLTAIDDLAPSFDAPSTKAFTRLLSNLNLESSRRILLISHTSDSYVRLSCRNIPHVHHTLSSTLCARDVLNADHVLIERSALDSIRSFYCHGGPAWAPLSSMKRAQ